ncbi:MAG: T9SS type A sorting domain-containing protein [Bacteroidota bacterium]|nr:T9SS type A sorting domain-containing protein [Bacteroidota bacterium]
MTKNAENSLSVGNVSLYLTPKMMAMVTPDTTYEFITNNNGGVAFELPVYIDSTTDISEFGESSSTVFPTVGSELNAFFTEKEQGQVSVYDLGGRVVKQQAFNDDNTYLNLSGLSTGMYVYSITSDNELLGTGKFVKQNTPLKGPKRKTCAVIV